MLQAQGNRPSESGANALTGPGDGDGDELASNWRDPEASAAWADGIANVLETVTSR